MTIFLLITIITLATLFISRNFINSAKRNLFKDQAAWSGKDVNIKYSRSNDISKSNKSDNYLKIIAEESKVYLEKQSNQETDQPY